MKTLVVRPGVEVVEKTLRGPWAPELSYLEKLYKNPGLIFRGLISLESFSSSSALAVGSILRKLGEEVEFLDVPFEFGIPLTEELNKKRNEKIEAYIAERGYDVVGISCTSVLECLATKRIAEAARRALKDVIIVSGGYQAASDAVTLMEKILSLDVVVLSDFEPIAEKLYASFDGERPIRTVPNIVYRENKTICASERKHLRVESEDLPVFDYSLIEKCISKYTFIPVEASRGCLYNCSFCQEKVLRQLYTVKDAQRAVDEIIDAANYVAQFIEPVTLYFCDALWGLNPKWVKTFCSDLIKRRGEICANTFGWGVEARIDQFTGQQLSLMKKAGCFTIGYGVESLSPTMLKMMNKTKDPHTYIASVFNTVQKTLKEDMQAVLLFILGMPGETPLTIKETVNALKKFSPENKNLHFQFGLPVPLAGTLLEKHIHDPYFVRKYGLKVIDEFDWEKVYLPRFTLLFDPSRELSAAEMTDIFLEITNGVHSIPTLEKQSSIFEEVKGILDKDQISPEELAQWGNIYRKIAMNVS